MSCQYLQIFKMQLELLCHQTEMKEQIANELTAMVMKTFMTAASPVASPTKQQNTLQSPIWVLETAIAMLLASNSSGKSTTTVNPMQ